MGNWIRSLALALVFALVGAFAASLWLEVRRETPAAGGVGDSQWEGRRIRVEVLNGAGIQDLARVATDLLRSRGFDVVYYGNFEGFGRDTSEAIARLASMEPARRVAGVLGLRKVTHRPNRDLYLDVTVILGTDWAQTLGHGPAPEPAGGSVWWRRVKRAARRLWPG